MKKRKGQMIQNIFKRYDGNPILIPEEMPFECYAVFNAGAIRYKEEYMLLLRTEDYTRKNIFYTATSENGYDFTINPEPINYPLSEIEQKYFGKRFDMRITA